MRITIHRHKWTYNIALTFLAFMVTFFGVQASENKANLLDSEHLPSLSITSHPRLSWQEKGKGKLTDEEIEAEEKEEEYLLQKRKREEEGINPDLEQEFHPLLEDSPSAKKHKHEEFSEDAFPFSRSCISSNGASSNIYMGLKTKVYDQATGVKLHDFEDANGKGVYRKLRHMNKYWIMKTENCKFPRNINHLTCTIFGIFSKADGSEAPYLVESPLFAQYQGSDKKIKFKVTPYGYKEDGFFCADFISSYDHRFKLDARDNPYDDMDFETLVDLHYYPLNSQDYIQQNYVEQDGGYLIISKSNLACYNGSKHGDRMALNVVTEQPQLFLIYFQKAQIQATILRMDLVCALSHP